MLVQYHIWRIRHNTMSSMGNKSPIKGSDVAQVYHFTLYFQWWNYSVHSKIRKLSHNMMINQILSSILRNEIK